MWLNANKFERLVRLDAPPLRNVVALVNNTVDLSCDTIPPDIHDEVILVLWFRENVGTPIFR